MNSVTVAPENTESDEEYWTDSSLDRAFEEVLQTSDRGLPDIPPPSIRAPEYPAKATTSQAPSTSANVFGSYPASNSQSVPVNNTGSQTTEAADRVPSPFSPQRLYPKLDMSDILASAMRTPPSRFSATRSQQSNVPRETYSSYGKSTASVHEEESVSDTDSEDDFSSPISLSPDGSPGSFNHTSPSPAERTNTRIFSASSRFSSPFNVLNSPRMNTLSQQQSDSMSASPYTTRDPRPAAHSPTPVTPVSRVSTPSSAAGRQHGPGIPLDRAATMPDLSSSSPGDSSPGPVPASRSKSMNDASDKPPGPKIPSFTLSPNPNGIVIIAHDDDVQTKMDERGVSWGAQYEIARGVCNGWWKWTDVTESTILENIKGKNNQQSAPRVLRDLMKGNNNGNAKGFDNHALWIELDREQDAIVEHADRGLGLMEDATWKGEKNWYGGRVQQILRLVEAPNREWVFKLDAMRMGRSHRFARYLGSRRVLLLKLPKNDKSVYAKMDELRAWLGQRFVLCGRLFVPFAVKDGKVYMCEINEGFGRKVDLREGDQWRLSLEELVAWHNPLELNKNQEVSKWTSRFDLGLSTSVPALEFLPENIVLIPDIYVDGYPERGKKAPAHTIFTDGCGFMNGAALMAIGQHMGYSVRPTAVQGRFLGSKGVWMLHPDDQDPTAQPKIWIRHSQRKIHLIEGGWTHTALRSVHRAHRIFDLLSPSRLTLPSRLNRLAILNLAHNGVSKDILVKLMDEGLRTEVDALRQWEGEGAMELLWHAVNRASGVTASRLQRVGTGLQRALGLAGRETDDSMAEREFNDEGMADGTAEDEAKPATIGETVLEKLQAGFTPLEDLQLCEDVKQVIKNTLESYIKQYHIAVPGSAEAFIVPDPYGVLAPGEIHFRSSQYLKDPLKHLNPQTLTGDVLIYRNPARLPSDIQKVRAVDHPKLSDYVDVIVLPIKGDRTLASLLAGGDVDGDTAVCIFDEDIVKAFRVPPVTEEPHDLKNYFEPLSTVLSVDNIIEETEGAMSEEEAKSTLQRHLLQGLCESPVGLYSIYHENCIYELGYDDPVTIRIACMFNTVLDSRKTGLRVKQKVFSEDKQRHGAVPPICLDGPADPQGRPSVKRKSASKGGPQGSFILDDLLDAGGKIQDEILKEYDKIIMPLQASSYLRDSDLTRPYLSLREAFECTEEASKSKNDVLKKELSLVTALIDKCLTDWQTSPWERSASKAAARKKGHQQAKQANDAIAAEVLKSYAGIPAGVEIFVLLGCLDRVKASYAYTKSVKFAWRVAHTELCRIKADAGKSRPLTKGFADVMAIPSAAVRVFAQHTGTLLPRD